MTSKDTTRVMGAFARFADAMAEPQEIRESAWQEISEVLAAVSEARGIEGLTHEQVLDRIKGVG